MTRANPNAPTVTEKPSAYQSLDELDGWHLDVDPGELSLRLVAPDGTSERLPRRATLAAVQEAIDRMGGITPHDVDEG